MFSFLSDSLRWCGQRPLLTRPSSATAGLPVPDRWRVTWRPPVGRTTGSGDPRANQLVQGRSLYPKGRVRRWLHRKPLRPFGYRLLEVRETGMVQLRVTTIPEVAIHWSSGFSRFTDRLDAGFRRRETIEYLKRQDGRKFTLMIHPGTAVIERCLICHDSQTTILMNS